MPSIYIGLGGTGLKIISRVKKRFAIEGINPGIDLQFLGLDIGGEDQEARQGLSNDEYILFDTGNVMNIIRSDRDYNPVGEWWFDRSVAPKFPFNRHGAGQIRTYGRLALAYNGNKLIERLNNVIDEFGGGSVNIIVISSVAGGTGGGIFADIPGIIGSLRSHIAEAQNDEYYGFLLLHDVVKRLYGITSNTDLNRIPKNALSLLTELDLINLHQTSPSTNLKIRGFDQVISQDPYNLIVLTGLHNEKLHRMDEKEDYFELISIGAHLFHELRGNWEGIENDLTAIAEDQYARDVFPINTKSGRQSEYSVPLIFPRNYVAFSSVILELEDEKITNYVEKVIANQIFNMYRSESGKIFERLKLEDYTSILDELRESEKSDKLIKHAHYIIEGIAGTKGQNWMINIGTHDLLRKTANNLMISEDLTRTINDYKDGIDRVLGDDTFLNNYQNLLKEKATNYIQSLNHDQTGIGNYELTILDKITILDKLLEEINYERNDVDSHEGRWLESNDIEGINSKLNESITDFKNYNPGLFSVFNKSRVVSARNSYAEGIANLLINDYLKFRLYEVIIPKIKLFYGTIYKYTEDILNTYNKNYQSLEEYAKTRPEFHGRIQPSTGGLNQIDFQIKIANTRKILDKYVLGDGFVTRLLKDKKISIDEIKGIKSKDDLMQLTKAHGEAFFKEKITLDNALKWEAIYFINDWPVEIFIDNIGGIACKGLKDLYKKSEKTKGLFDYFINDIAKSFFDISIIGSDSFKQTICKDVISAEDQNYLAKQLILARLQAIIQNLLYPYVNCTGKAEKLKLSRENQNIENNIRPIYKTHRQNSFLIELMHNEIRFNGSSIDLPDPARSNDIFTSKTKAEFYSLKLGFPLMEAEIISSLENIENSRIESNLNYYTMKDYRDNYHNDKRFACMPKYLAYSPLVWFEGKQDQLINPWKLILLLLTQRVISIEGMKVIVKQNIRSSDRTVIKKDSEFDDLETLYKFFLVVDEGHITELIDTYQKILKDLENPDEMLNVTLKEFKDKQYAEALNSALDEYVKILFS